MYEYEDGLQNVFNGEGTDVSHSVISVVSAAAASTTRSRSVVLAVRHVPVTASKTREVDGGTTAGDGKSSSWASVSTRWASPSARSAQTREAVSVHQESLIH
jgi:hypothetical protein